MKNIVGDVVRYGLKMLHLNVNEEREHLLIQIFKFVIVGVVATIIDFIFLYIFKEICQLPILISNTLSFVISVFYNYFASLTFVFDINKEKSQKKNFVIFVICSVMGLILNNGIVWLMTDFWHIYYMFSKVVATLFVMIFNFVTRKKFLE